MEGWGGRFGLRWISVYACRHRLVAATSSQGARCLRSISTATCGASECRCPHCSSRLVARRHPKSKATPRSGWFPCLVNKENNCSSHLVWLGSGSDCPSQTGFTRSSPQVHRARSLCSEASVHRRSAQSRRFCKALGRFPLQLRGSVPGSESLIRAAIAAPASKLPLLRGFSRATLVEALAHCQSGSYSSMSAHERVLFRQWVTILVMCCQNSCDVSQGQVACLFWPRLSLNTRSPQGKR